jgi:hypothetical protein
MRMAPGAWPQAQRKDSQMHAIMPCMRDPMYERSSVSVRGYCYITQTDKIFGWDVAV